MTESKYSQQPKTTSPGQPIRGNKNDRYREWEKKNEVHILKMMDTLYFDELAHHNSDFTPIRRERAEMNTPNQGKRSNRNEISSSFLPYQIDDLLRGQRKRKCNPEISDELTYNE